MSSIKDESTQAQLEWCAEYDKIQCFELRQIGDLEARTFGHDATASSRSAQRSDGLVPWRMVNIVNPVDTWW